MHEFVTGHWAASTYSSKGNRTDHVLFLSPDGSFRWVTERPSAAGPRREERAGGWTHDPAEDVLYLTSTDADGPATVGWSIHYVTGCEDSNLILVLRWVAIASRNLPIHFQRIHPPEDLVWAAS